MRERIFWDSHRGALHGAAQDFPAGKSLTYPTVATGQPS